MPANIDSMMYVGKTPWHKEGVALTKPPSIKDALDHAGLNWSVEKRNTYYHYKENEKFLGSENSYIQVPNNYVIIRQDTDKPIGTVGRKYEIVQNDEAFKPFDVLIDYGYELETAGALQGGKKVWILAKAPEKYMVGDDKMLRYAFLYTSHDGSSGSCLRDTMVRVVCQNTVDLALRGNKTCNWSIRHTKSIHERIDKITNQLRVHKGNIKEAVDVMNRMYESKIHNKSELTNYFEAVIPRLKERHKESIPELGIFTRNTAKPLYEKLVHNFENGIGNNGRSVWDAYQAITEYYTHNLTGSEHVWKSQFGSAYKTKIKAFQIASEMANNQHQKYYMA